MTNEYIAHQETLGEFTLKIIGDDNAQNPYTDYDQLTDIISWHRNYDFTTGAKYASPSEVMKALESGELVYAVPLYAYEHGMITVKLGSMDYRWPDQQWDCGLLGFVYVTKKKAKAEFPNYRNRTLWHACNRVAKWEVRAFDDYLTNNCYGYEITNGDGEVVDSCWGYLGDWNSYVLEEGRSQLKYWYERTPEQKMLPFEETN